MIKRFSVGGFIRDIQLRNTAFKNSEGADIIKKDRHSWKIFSAINSSSVIEFWPTFVVFLPLWNSLFLINLSTSFYQFHFLQRLNIASVLLFKEFPFANDRKKFWHLYSLWFYPRPSFAWITWSIECEESTDDEVFMIPSKCFSLINYEWYKFLP